MTKFRNQKVYSSILILFFILYSSVNLGYLDDDLFKHAIDHQSLLQFLTHRYFTWSSRVFIEGILVFLSNQHLLWFVINSLSWVLVFKSLENLFNTQSKVILSLVIIMFILNYRHNYLSSAGWIATTLNYSWPLSLGVYVLSKVKKLFVNMTLSIWEYGGSLIALLLASNVEQVAIILFIFFTVILINMISIKKKFYFVWISYSVIIFNLLLIFLSPGNYARKIAEVTTWFPEYASLSVFRLADLGFSSTLFPVFIKPDIVYILVSFIIFIGVILHQKSNFKRVIASLPFLFQLVFSVFFENSKVVFPFLSYIKSSLTKIGTGMSFSSPISFIPNILLFILLMSLIYTVYNCFDDKKVRIMALTILFAGLVSRFVLVLSPTIWASVERTFIFMQFSFISIALLSLNEFDFEIMKSKMNIAYVYSILIVLSIFGFIANYYEITFMFR